MSQHSLPRPARIRLYRPPNRLLKRLLLAFALAGAASACGEGGNLASSTCAPGAATQTVDVSASDSALPCGVTVRGIAALADGPRATLEVLPSLAAELALHGRSDDLLDSAHLKLLGGAAFRFSATLVAKDAYTLTLPVDASALPSDATVALLTATRCGGHCKDNERILFSLHELASVDLVGGVVEAKPTGRKTARFQLVLLDSELAAAWRDVQAVEGADVAAGDGEASKIGARAYGLTKATKIRIEQRWLTAKPRDYKSIERRTVAAIRKTEARFTAGKLRAPLAIDLQYRHGTKLLGYATVSGFGDSAVLAIDVPLNRGGVLKLEATAAHELFHTLQGASSNWSEWSTETQRKNDWFIEGSAEWAADVLFDNSDSIIVPDSTRFTSMGLALETAPGSYACYETQAFFKWLESQHAGTTLAVLETVMAQTVSESTQGGVRVVSLSQRQPSYVGALSTAIGGAAPDYIKFSEAIHFSKRFEIDEKALWSLQSMGTRDKLPDVVYPSVELSRGGPGDGQSRRVRLKLEGEPLKTSIRRIKVGSGDDGLSGPVQLRARSVHGRVGACLINLVSKKSKCQSVEHGQLRLAIAAESGDQVALLLADTRWVNSNLFGDPIAVELWAGADVFFTVQQKAQLTGKLLQRKLEQCNTAISCNRSISYYKNSLQQEISGRFEGGADVAVERIRLEDTPEARAAALYIDGKRVADNIYQHAEGAPLPKRWRVVLDGWKWPRDDHMPFPRYIIAELGDGAQVKTPLVFLFSAQVDVRLQYYFYAGAGTTSLGQSVSDVARVSYVARSIDVFYGDSDTWGDDSLKGWPGVKHSGISFVPASGAGGKAVGTFEQTPYPLGDFRQVLATAGTSGSGHFYNVFGDSKRTVDLRDVSWSLPRITESPGNGTLQQMLASPLPAAPQLLDGIRIQRDLPEAERKRLAAAGIDPEPELVLSTR